MTDPPKNYQAWFQSPLEPYRKDWRPQRRIKYRRKADTHGHFWVEAAQLRTPTGAVKKIPQPSNQSPLLQRVDADTVTGTRGTYVTWARVSRGSDGRAIGGADRRTRARKKKKVSEKSLIPQDAFKQSCHKCVNCLPPHLRLFGQTRLST